jgi:hypothetical protein
MRSARTAGGAKLRLLLASSSVAALLVGGGVPPAFAACPTSIPPPNSGCTNPAGTTITGIQVTGFVNGSITNAGKISTNGIVLTDTGTVTGAIVDEGDLTGGTHWPAALPSVAASSSTARSFPATSPTPARCREQSAC